MTAKKTAKKRDISEVTVYSATFSGDDWDYAVLRMSLHPVLDSRPSRSMRKFKEPVVYASKDRKEQWWYFSCRTRASRFAKVPGYLRPKDGGCPVCDGFDEDPTSLALFALLSLEPDFESLVPEEPLPEGEWVTASADNVRVGSAIRRTGIPEMYEYVTRIEPYGVIKTSYNNYYGPYYYNNGGLQVLVPAAEMQAPKAA